MRMWMIDPKFLCKNHLLGEHSELHKHRHCFVKQYSVKGRIEPVIQIEPMSMQKRHDELAQEMIKRGYNHKSDYVQPDINYLPNNHKNAKVDLENSIKDLKQRCPECNKQIIGKI